MDKLIEACVPFAYMRCDSGPAEPRGIQFSFACTHINIYSDV